MYMCSIWEEWNGKEKDGGNHCWSEPMHTGSANYYVCLDKGRIVEQIHSCSKTTKFKVMWMSTALLGPKCDRQYLENYLQEEIKFNAKMNPSVKLPFYIK